jgi:hypothetical protein
VTGHIDPELDSNMPVGRSQSVVFLFNNQGSLPATGVNVNMDQLPPDFKPDPDGNTCTGTLAPGHGCQISGIYTAALGFERISMSLSYKEGNDVFLTTGTTGRAVVVKGEVFLLPENMLVGKGADVIFTFANQGGLPAIALLLFINYLEGSVEVSIVEPSLIEFLPQNACQIVRSYMAPETVGPASIGWC